MLVLSIHHSYMKSSPLLMFGLETLYAQMSWIGEDLDESQITRITTFKNYSALFLGLY